MSEIISTLEQRGQQYGRFYDQARYVQGLKGVLHSAPNWGNLEPDQKEALEMVVHKISRILNGNPNNIDSWHDIVGYASLVEKRLNGEVL